MMTKCHLGSGLGAGAVRRHQVKAKKTLIKSRLVNNSESTLVC